MADPTITTLSRVRTYARDLERERKKSGLAAEAVLPTPPTPASTPTKTPRPPTPPQPPVNASKDEIIDLNDSESTVVISDAVRQTRADETRKNNKEETTTIPSLHSLRSDVAEITNKKTPADLAVSMIEDESAATIITDTKTDRFSVTTGIFSSLKKWWADSVRRRQEKKAPKYVVPESDRRKGIIQTATSHTARGATSGYGKIRDQVRLRNTTPVLTEPTTTWTPNTETVWPLLETGDEPKATKVSTPGDSAIPTPPPPVTPTPQKIATPPPVEIPQPTHTVTVPDPAPVLEPTPVVYVQEPVNLAPTITPSWSDTVVDTEPAIVEAPAKTTASAEPAVSSIEQKRSSRFTDRINTTTLALSIVGIFVIGFVLFITVRFLINAETAIPAGTLSGLLLQVPTVQVTTETVTKDALVARIREFQNDDPGTKEIHFSTSSVSHTPATLLAVIDPSVDPNLGQATPIMVFGWYEKTQPFIIMRTTDTTTALGGMLKWEATMPDSLNVLFSIPENTIGSFTDYRFGVNDIRTFTNTNGREFITYGFTRPDTLIITTNSATWVALSTLVTTAP